MKSLTINSLVVALSLSLCWTPSMAATMELSSQPLSQSEKHTTSAAATSPAPFYALHRLDAESLAAQEMTDQELKATEGGLVVIAIIGVLIGMLLPPVEQPPWR